MRRGVLPHLALGGGTPQLANPVLTHFLNSLHHPINNNKHATLFFGGYFLLVIHQVWVVSSDYSVSIQRYACYPRTLLVLLCDWLTKWEAGQGVLEVRRWRERELKGKAIKWGEVVM